MKRLFAFSLSLLLLVGTLAVCAAPVAAEGKETILVAGSDFQVSGFKTTNVDLLLETLSIFGITKADRAFFCGDYTIESMESATSYLGIQKLKNVFAPLVGKQTLFVQGNHDIETTAGLAKAGNNDPANKAYGAFVIQEDQYRDWGNKREDTAAAANNLRIYLEQKYSQGFKNPIFVLCHIPLHWSNRTLKDGSGTDADLLVDVLNEYGEKGLNLLFLYGHNHSGGYDDAMGGGAVYLKKGDSMEVCHGNKWEHKTRTLNFTYMNAGFIGYYSTTEPTADNAVTISVFRIQEDGSVIITRYDKNGIHPLKSKGVWHPDWNKEGYHLTPNTLEYASSRKVTATDDVPVDPPIPVPTVPTTTTTTTDFYSTTTHYGGVVMTKPTGTATGAEDPIVTSGNEGASGTATGEAPSATEGDTDAELSATQKTTKAASAQASATQWGPFSWWVWLLIGVIAVVFIGSVIVIIVLVRPKK
ncbi:MAG: hypothetical protein IJN76_03655 [Clostridia bacterium]|nr:hypothetical protein [Clostridia bacterium]